MRSKKTTHFWLKAQENYLFFQGTKEVAYKKCIENSRDYAEKGYKYFILNYIFKNI